MLQLVSPDQCDLPRVLPHFRRRTSHRQLWPAQQLQQVHSRSGQQLHHSQIEPGLCTNHTGPLLVLGLHSHCALPKHSHWVWQRCVPNSSSMLPHRKHLALGWALLQTLL